MATVTIRHKGETRTVDITEGSAALDDMVARLGAWEHGVSTVEQHAEPFGRGPDPDGALPPARTEPVELGNSTWSKQVTDDAAKTRIEGLHEQLRAAGVSRAGEGQLYSTGTRMADVGYATQANRAKDHQAKQPIREVAHQLADVIEAEKRHQIEVSAGNIVSKLAVINGAVTFDGYKLREQAIRGLLARCQSPSAGYIFGLRDRIVAARARLNDRETPPSLEEVASLNRRIASDRAEMLDTLRYEMSMAGDVPIVFRAREGLGDIFATVSPGYGIADAPSVIPDILAALPEDARGTFTYDAMSTAWEIKSSIWTPTATDQQAVGEPFEGYNSVYGRDNGTGGLGSGGGVNILACLNASVFVAFGEGASRIHRKRVLVNIGEMILAGTQAINALVTAWGQARADVLPEVRDKKGALVPMEEVIPGFFRHMLTARRGELVGILPGRTEKHVKALALAFDGERRTPGQLPTRADLAQGFTRYIQEQPTLVRMNAEQGIGAWLANGSPVEYAAA